MASSPSNSKCVSPSIVRWPVLKSQTAPCSCSHVRPEDHFVHVLGHNTLQFNCPTLPHSLHYCFAQQRNWRSVRHLQIGGRRVLFITFHHSIRKDGDVTTRVEQAVVVSPVDLDFQVSFFRVPSQCAARSGFINFVCVFSVFHRLCHFQGTVSKEVSCKTANIASLLFCRYSHPGTFRRL